MSWEHKHITYTQYIVFRESFDSIGRKLLQYIHLIFTIFENEYEKRDLYVIDV